MYTLFFGICIHLYTNHFIFYKNGYITYKIYVYSCIQMYTLFLKNHKQLYTVIFYKKDKKNLYKHFVYTSAYTSVYTFGQSILKKKVVSVKKAV